MKHYVISFFIIFANYVNIQAQIVHADRVSLDPTDTEHLHQFFTEFQVFEIDPLQLKAYFSSNEIETTFLKLEQAGTLELQMQSTRLMAFAYQAQSEEYKENYTFKGTLSNGNKVRLTIDDDFIYGYFEQEGQLLFVEPLRFLLPNGNTTNHYVFYKESSVIERSSSTCAATDLTANTSDLKHQIDHAKAMGCVEVNLAIASDKGMYDRYGSVADVEDRNIGVMNNVQGDYDNAFSDEIRFIIVKQVVIINNSDPFGTMSSTDIVSALNAFTNWANIGGFGTSFDLGQLWSATDFTITDENGNTNSTPIGLAYRPGVCGSSFKYHVLEDFQGGSGLMRGLVSHEIGHNFAATHDDISGQNIMNSFLTDTQVWSNQSKSEINNHVASSSCQSGSNSLGDCIGGNSNAQPSVSITQPDDGDSFPENSNITVRANASDSDGNITGVELFLNGFSQGVDSNAPYKWMIQSNVIGENFIQVVATDNNGGTDQETISIQITMGTSNECEEDLSISDNTVSGLYEASNSIETEENVEVNIFNSATFRAGNIIQLNPGFWARENSTFTTEIATPQNCDNSLLENRTQKQLETSIRLQPNPANDFTEIIFKMPMAGFARIDLYNSNGQHVRTLLNMTNQAEGVHQFNLSTHDLRAGLFYVILTTETTHSTQKLVVLK